MSPEIDLNQLGAGFVEWLKNQAERGLVERVDTVAPTSTLKLFLIRGEPLVYYTKYKREIGKGWGTSSKVAFSEKIAKELESTGIIRQEAEVESKQS